MNGEPSPVPVTESPRALPSAMHLRNLELVRSNHNFRRLWLAQLISEIGDWVFEQAITAVGNWHDRLGCEIQVSVNNSPAQFERDAPSVLQQAIANGRLPANGIAVEITEGLLLRESSRVREQLQALHRSGIEVSIDDFGTGMTSISHLKLWPINQLKLDRSIVRELPGNQHDVTLAKAILALGKSLKLNVVAEGIETEAQREFLLREGCEEGQGYLYSHPVTHENLAKRLVH